MNKNNGLQRALGMIERNAPCVARDAFPHSKLITIAGWYTCPDTWAVEYSGWLVAQRQLLNKPCTSAWTRLLKQCQEQQLTPMVLWCSTLRLTAALAFHARIITRQKSCPVLVSRSQTAIFAQTPPSQETVWELTPFFFLTGVRGSWDRWLFKIPL